MIQDWRIITFDALQELWQSFIVFFPKLIVAIIIFVIGWFIAMALGKLIAEILKKIKFNQIFEKGSWDEALAKADIKIDVSSFVGAIVKWVLVIVFLQVAVGIIGWTPFADLLDRFVGYLPNVIIAALIFVVTVIVADIIEKVVRVSVERTNIGHGHTVSAIIKWAIWIFAIVIILDQLNIAGILPQTIIVGVVAFLVLAGGLAFGLGGKDAAGKMLEDLRGKLAKK